MPVNPNSALWMSRRDGSSYTEIDLCCSTNSDPYLVGGYQNGAVIYNIAALEIREEPQLKQICGSNSDPVMVLWVIGEMA